MKEPLKDWTVEYSERAKEDIAKDPKLAEFVRESSARMRQVMHDFEAGKFRSVDEALRSIGMTPVDPDDVPDEVRAIAEKSEEE